jgi:N-acetylglucosaminyl-diphospho-decaprenol L-rhamnosyltransferase
MTTPTVRVVVVTYSPGTLLATCLASLRQATVEPIEVVLADNGSTDGEPQRAVERFGAQLRGTGGNLGYGAAANIGAAGNEAPWLLVCNPDVEFAPGSVDRLLEAGRRWPRAGSLGPAVFDPDGTSYPSAREVPTLVAGSAHAVIHPFWPGNPWTRRYRGEDVRDEQPVGWLSGSCLLLRRQAWEQVGGFDARYFMYFEDVDIGDRLGRHGWLNVFVPSACVTHVGGTTTARSELRMAAAHHDSAYRFVVDRYPRPVAEVVRLGLKVRLAMLSRGG